MFETMYAAPGIGLAAPQVNVSKRIFTVDLQDDDATHGPLVVINPKFTLTEGEIEATEGCLSVPGMVGEMTRFEHVVCTGLDRRGQEDRTRGCGPVRALPAARNGSSQRRALHRQSEEPPSGRDRRGAGGSRSGVNALKAVFFGTSAFAVPALRRLAERAEVVGGRHATRSSRRARSAAQRDAGEAGGASARHHRADAGQAARVRIRTCGRWGPAAASSRRTDASFRRRCSMPSRCG